MYFVNLFVGDVHKYPCVNLLVSTAEQCLLFCNVGLLFMLHFHAFHLFKQKCILVVAANQTGCTI